MNESDGTGRAQADGTGKVVFMVDDDPGIRLFTSGLLERSGYRVILAASAAEASEVIESFEGEIDVLLMDIRLPDGFGATVAQRLRLVRPGMAVVYTTGFASEDPILAGGLNDAEFVVMKPFTAEQLMSELERAMAARG